MKNRSLQIICMLQTKISCLRNLCQKFERNYSQEIAAQVFVLFNKLIKLSVLFLQFVDPTMEGVKKTEDVSLSGHIWPLP